MRVKKQCCHGTEMPQRVVLITIMQATVCDVSLEGVECQVWLVQTKMGREVVQRWGFLGEIQDRN